MTSRINYNQPLKSVRTIRAAKVEEYDPRSALVDDTARSSDADLMHDAGVAFSWEREPGRSKVDQDYKEAASFVGLKPPPQGLAPPPSSKLPSVEIPTSPAPVGTESNGRSSHHFLNNGKLHPTEAVPAADSQSARSQPTTAIHQPPPKPSQSKPPLAAAVQASGDKPPPSRRHRSASVTESSQTNASSPLLSRTGRHEQPSARRTAKNGEGSRRHDSALPATLYTVTTGDDSTTPRTDPNGAVILMPFPSDGGVPGNEKYISARLGQPQSPALPVKDFYLSKRYVAISPIHPSGNVSRGTNSCMPTRPHSASASESGSHSDDGDQIDLGDSFSQMNARYTDVRCQVSIMDGDQLESSSRHTDPRARDFILERFLPAAKAMVTDSPDGLDRRSSQDTRSLSPTRKNGRSSVLRRSRFAFKDRFAEEEEHEEVDQRELLFNCKFPWQMGALWSAGPAIIHEPGSAEQSPSSSFANKYSPSPTASFEHQKESSPRPYSDGQHEDAAWTYAESDGSPTPRDDNICGFEERGLTPESRTEFGPTHRGQRSKDSDVDRDSNRSLSMIGESATGAYECEHSGRSNETSDRASADVPKDRLRETGTQDDSRGGHVEKIGRSPEMVYAGSLGSLLRTTQQQRKDLGRNSEAAIRAALANVQQEAIPPSSILNHHRNKPARAAAAAAMSSAYGPNHLSTKPTCPVNGVAACGSSSYPRHLQVNLIRQEVAEPSGGSGRSLESLNDDVWESARESPVASESYERSGKVFGSNTSSFSDSAKEGVQSSGWPLVKIQQLYARTPSSDSKEASFSSVSERSLRSPTNLAMTIQQQSTEKYSPVSVLQPPLPKSPSESWLFKVKPPSSGTNWQGPKPKKFLDYSALDDSMDIKWEVMVKSENAKLRSKMAQEVQRKGTGLEKSDILGSKGR